MISRQEAISGITTSLFHLFILVIPLSVFTFGFYRKLWIHPTGYVFNNNCAFGVEIFLTGGKSSMGCLSMISKPTTIYHTWKVSNFSSLPDRIVSEPFGCNKWYVQWFHFISSINLLKCVNLLWIMCCRNILLFSNGQFEAKGNSISIYLGLQKSVVEEIGLLAKFVLRVKNQTSKEDVEYKCKTGRDYINYVFYYILFYFYLNFKLVAKNNSFSR